MNDDRMARRGRVLLAICRAEDWEVLDLILDSLSAEGAEDGTPEGVERGAWIGFHLGLVHTVGERPSFTRLVDRYQAQLDKHLPGTDARALLGL